MSKILNMLMAFVMSFGISGSNVNPSDIPENSNFEVHFIDVGQADSALIECDGETMMIDGGNVADSNVVAAYLKKEDVTELNYVVCSHAHEDHVGGTREDDGVIANHADVYVTDNNAYIFYFTHRSQDCQQLRICFI